MLTTFLKVEKEHTFEIAKIMLHTGEKSPKDNVAFNKSTLKTSFKLLLMKHLI